MTFCTEVTKLSYSRFHRIVESLYHSISDINNYGLNQTSRVQETDTGRYFYHKVRQITKTIISALCNMSAKVYAREVYFEVIFFYRELLAKPSFDL